MNDLTAIREALGKPEPPSQAAHAAARAALVQRSAAARISTSGHARHRRTRWLAGTVGLAAAAVAAVITVVTPGAPSPGGLGKPPALAISRLSGSQILLAAATAAAAQPASTGRYWYLKESVPDRAGPATMQDWYTKDGSLYTLLPQYKGVYLASADGGFSVGASSLTYRQIRQLPTDPAALTAWITRSFYHPVGPPPPPGVPRAQWSPPPRTEIAGYVAVSLSELLSEEPAPPAIRAAAFRALAALPNVTKLGQDNGNVVLRIWVRAPSASKFPSGNVPDGADEMKLIIDTSTMTVHAWSNYQGTMTILAARWTNTLPKVIPDSRLAHSKAQG